MKESFFASLKAKRGFFFVPREMRIYFWLYITVLIGLFLYSFTQIDLSLTFSRIALLRILVKLFQYIGYFNRPLSTNLYFTLLIALSGFYFYFLRLAYKKKLSTQFVWTLIASAAVLLTFSYNAFSYDLFNYIFDAKIVTYYHQNPYQHKALDYPGDPMLSFMHWTHRTYPYGPAWLILTVPLSFLGWSFLPPTFALFKLLMSLGFLGSLYYMGRIFQKVAPAKENFGLVFFGLNPLVLIESLVSGHLDIVMVFFSLWSFYLLVETKYILSLILLATSIGVKFATVFLLPVYVLVFLMQQRKRIEWYYVFLCAVILLSFTAYIVAARTTFQPWYLVVPLSFAVFLADRCYVFIPSSIISLAALLKYVPFLYLGNWDKPVPQILSTIYMGSYVVSILAVIVFCFYKRKRILACP